jgi:hypothetical protein
VIESQSPHASRRSVYSLQSGALEVVTTVTMSNGAANTVSQYYDK